MGINFRHDLLVTRHLQGHWPLITIFYENLKFRILRQSQSKLTKPKPAVKPNPAKSGQILPNSAY